MKLGITEYIDAAHHLPGHEKCGRMHGHTYQVDVVVEGDHRGAMVLDFADMKRVVRDVLVRYDHRDWNDVLEYPSVENICEILHRDLNKNLQFPFHIRVWEGHGKWAEL